MNAAGDHPRTRSTSFTRTPAFRWLLAGALLVGLAGGGYAGSVWLRGLWAADTIPSHTVVRTSFERRIGAEGNLQAVKATPLSPTNGARMPLKIEWLADDGVRVKEGDVVARFDPSEWRKKLEDGQAARDTADKKMAKERILVGTAIDDRERESRMSQRELEQTQRFQRKNDQIFSRNEIIESEIDEQYSRAKMTHADAAKGIESSLSKSKLDLLGIEKRTAELLIKQAEEGLEGLVLTAPHEGIVVLKRNWRGEVPRVGDQVWPGQPIAEIPHTESMEAEVYVLESDAGGMEEGLSADVVIEAFPDKHYQGTIKRIDKLAKPRIRGVPVRYFGVIVELEETDPAVMKPGQRVRAVISMAKREALLVPRPAVFEKDGATVVYVERDGEFQATPIVIGASSPGLVVVDEGLSEGDRVALINPTRPKSGDGEGDSETKDKGGASSGSKSPKGPRGRR